MAADDLSTPLGRGPINKRLKLAGRAGDAARRRAGVRARRILRLDAVRQRSAWAASRARRSRSANHRISDGTPMRQCASAGKVTESRTVQRRRASWQACGRHAGRRDHHRRLDRQAAGSAVARNGEAEARRPAIRACWNRRATASFRRSAPMARARRMPMRCRATMPTTTDAPRIAIVVTGLGIGTKLTETAIAKLPRRGDACVRALQRRTSKRWREKRARPAMNCCCRFRWSRSIIPTTIPARRRC